MSRQSKTYVKPSGKLANMKPNPSKSTGGSTQPKGMKSNARLHADAKKEDNGKL